MSTATYPRRERFYSQRVIRAMAKSCAAQEIGPEGCWLVTTIAGVEDAKRYSGPVTFWNEQLMPICGFGGRRRLVLARKKAVDAGWLHYEPGGKSRAGIYWVLIPTEFAGLDNSPIDETSSESRSEMERQTCANPNGDAFAVPKRNSKRAQCGTANVHHSYPSPIPNTSCPVTDVTGPANYQVKPRARSTFTEADKALANWFWEQILAMQPDRTPPKLDQWANTFRLMRERDGRTDEQIRSLFSKVNRDSFWRTNVLCPDKLRQQWDDLRLKLGRNGNGKSSEPQYKRLTPPQPSAGRASE